MTELSHSSGPVLFFDGICNLCNGAIRFIIKNDKKKIFRFSSLQSPFATDALGKIFTDARPQPDSLILLYKGVYYVRSEAVLYTLYLLGGLWRAAFMLRVLPRGFRDRAYNIVSRNRYKWFGKRDNCMIPSAEIGNRFI